MGLECTNQRDFTSPSRRVSRLPSHRPCLQRRRIPGVKRIPDQPVKKPLPLEVPLLTLQESEQISSEIPRELVGCQDFKENTGRIGIAATRPMAEHPKKRPALRRNSHQTPEPIGVLNTMRMFLLGDR